MVVRSMTERALKFEDGKAQEHGEANASNRIRPVWRAFEGFASCGHLLRDNLDEGERQSG